MDSENRGKLMMGYKERGFEMKFAFQRDHSRCGVENGMVGKEFKCENI